MGIIHILRIKGIALLKIPFQILIKKAKGWLVV